MDDYSWLYAAMILAYIIGAIALIIDELWLLFVAMGVTPIVLLWRCGDEREKKKSA